MLPSSCHVVCVSDVKSSALCSFDPFCVPLYIRARVADDVGLLLISLLNFFSLSFSFLQCIYGCYVHSAILPTFHRRCYWLLQVLYISKVDPFSPREK